MSECKPFMSLRDAANYTGLSVSFLRQGVKDGRFKFLMSGQKYLLNMPELLKDLGIDMKGDEEK